MTSLSDQTLESLLAGAGPHVTETTLRNLKKWFADPSQTAADRQSVLSMASNRDWSTLQDAFFQDLEFGTGGLRGVVGAGTNRINAAQVARVSQGVAKYIEKNFPPADRKVVIAYDSRINSKSFAEICAKVFAGNGITAFLFSSYETTPCLSFAVRDLNCAIGFCLTASHNPPEYAGLKVYSKDGAQIVPPVDKVILTEVALVTSGEQVKVLDMASSRIQGLVLDVPDGVSQRYFLAVKKLETFPGAQRTVSVAYTPLHGTGALPAETVMKSWGFNHFFVVPEQKEPDGKFPTVKKPNPEEPDALTMLVQYAEEKDADVGFANDPDSDRLALISREDKATRSVFANQTLGHYVLLNGNQTGAILLHFILEQWQKQNRLPPGASVIKTIVTTELHSLICKKFGVRIFDTLTGFKWIAALVRDWEESNSQNHYIFGTEESYGYMPGTYVRDKDGIATLAMAAEMADWFKKENSSPCQQLLKIFQEFGAWADGLQTIDLEGLAGQKRITALMNMFRENPPHSVGTASIESVEDYSNGAIKTATERPGVFRTEQKKLSLPSSNVLIFRLSDGGQVAVRPSGTEPKIKFYYSAHSRTSEDGKENYQAAQQKIEIYRQIFTDLCQ